MVLMGAGASMPHLPGTEELSSKSRRVRMSSSIDGSGSAIGWLPDQRLIMAPPGGADGRASTLRLVRDNPVTFRRLAQVHDRRGVTGLAVWQ
jgi:hypothetical protein